MTINISSAKNDNQSGYRHISIPVEEVQEFEGILQKIVYNLGALLELEFCSVALLDPHQDKPVTLATFQKLEHRSRPTLSQEFESLASWVAQHHEALIIDNASHDSRFEFTDRTLTGSLASVPLIDKDNFLGALTAIRSATNSFGSHEMHLLTIFAGQATLTIINAYQAAVARRDAARMKANFLSMITHELRAPLNSINGYLDLALEGIAGELNQQQHEFVQRARAGSEHLYALIEDLLLISRADAGQLRLNPQAINLPELVANAIEDLQLIAMDHEITTTIEIANNLPPIDADPVRLQQVLRNLIHNALHFTPPGGTVIISARVINNISGSPYAASFETIEDQRRLEVHVRDTGIGIATEYQERIFDRFFQIPSADTGRISGQGLGLAIAKIIVELHGGQIAVDSVPSTGSTFTCTLPLVLRK